LILAVIGFLFATTAYVAMLITIRQEALWKTTRYEDPWVVSQALVELTRLEQRVSAFGLPWTGVDKEEVELRFDILQSRLQLFREGEIQDFIQRDPERRKIQDQLAAAIAAAEPLIKQIEHPGSAQRLLAVLAPLNHQLAFLTTAAFTFDGERVVEDQRNLTRLHLVFAALLGALAVSGVALIGFLYWHNRALEQARKDMSRSAAAAREARHRFEITLENMDQGILMYDASGVIRVYNTKAVELLDLPEELMASQPSFQALREYQLAQGEFSRSDECFRQWVARSGFKDTPDAYERERPNGRVLEVRTVPLLDGGAVRTFTDITGRKQAEALIRQANETLASLISASPVGIINVNTDLTIGIWNRAAEGIFGYTAEEIIGRRYNVLVPEEEAETFQSLFERLKRGEVLHNNMVQRRRKDGTLVDVNASGAGLFGPAGELRGAVITLEDVTERKRLEERLRQSQKMEAVGQLTGGIAHDFNNLLTIILGNAEILAEGSSNSALTQTLSRTILEAAERGADLTQHLLTFGRRQSLKPVQVNLDRVVKGMTPLLERAIGANIEFRAELSDRLYQALTDRTLLESAILNLVVNARDAMPQGGVLTVATGEAVSEARQGQLPIGQDVVFVRISDTGVGMPPEVLARVFEPFYTTKEIGKGSGLGLSMVYGFAQQSGGHVSIQSTEGEGTSVMILLPAVECQSVPPIGKDERASTPEGSKESVLLVEDEPQVLRFVSAQLISLGYEITAVSTGPDALDLLRDDQRFDLLFTDVVLPKGMSGVELAKRARRIKPGLKVLLTSGYSEEVFEQHCRPDKDIPLLRKPYKRKELAEMLRQILEQNVA
jgi:PAS domain S-box-containing protein